MDLNKLSNQLVKHEEIRFKPYLDTVGKITIGVGHNLSDKGLTPNQVGLILQDDIKDVVTFLTLRLPWVLKLDDVRARAVADMAFVLMDKLLDFHTMLPALQEARWKDASDALLNSKFASQVGKRAIDLANMILSGQDQ